MNERRTMTSLQLYCGSFPSVPDKAESLSSEGFKQGSKTTVLRQLINVQREKNSNNTVRLIRGCTIAGVNEQQ
ncbi:hypothetical protein T10_4249 [Trichinella papuae]|uniref:Uncharacterized protein n=1 Tax=Trichinella papuae TaxID=268474 RepID=A0A0V1MK69_9BILA|nr:hypothetical protein T10_4249 [Trichinella papuae]